MKRKLVAVFFLFVLVISTRSVHQNEPKEELNAIADSNVPIPTNKPNATTSTDIFYTPTPTPTTQPITQGKDFFELFIKDSENILFDKTLFRFTNYDRKENPEMLPDSVYLDSTLNENKKVSFIKTYLKECNIYKEEPDGIIYNNGKCFAEYYFDKESGNICFVLHIPSENGIYCITLYWEELESMGSLMSDYDSEQNIFYESFYDTKEKKLTSIANQYIPGFPFPFIIENKSINGDSYEYHFNQRFYFFKDKASFDETGRCIGYNDDLYEPNKLCNTYTCSYNKKGNLVKIEQIIPESYLESDLAGEHSSEYYDEMRQRDYSGEIKLSYRKNGSLKTVNYRRSPWIYGTTFQSGEMHYDENDRMIYEKSYITHGSLYNFYLYKGDEKKPWVCIYIDAAPGSYSKKNGIGYKYGDDVSIDLYQSN